MFDGDGRAAKQSELTNTLQIPGGWTGWQAVPTYNLYSSVTGEKVTELNDTGAFYRNHVYMGHTEIAWQDASDIMWKLTDPISGSTRQTNQDGSLPSGDEEETRIELAGLKNTYPIMLRRACRRRPMRGGCSTLDPENGCVDSLERPAPCSELKFAPDPAPTPLPYTDPPTPVPDNVASIGLKSGLALSARVSNDDGDDEPIVIHTSAPKWPEAFEFVLKQYAEYAGGPDQLGDCVVRLLAEYYPDMSVDGRGVEIAADARFNKGIPLWAKVPGSIGIPGTVVPGPLRLTVRHSL